MSGEDALAQPITLTGGDRSPRAGRVER